MRKEYDPYAGPRIPFGSRNSKNEIHFYRIIDNRLINEILDPSDFIEVNSDGKVIEIETKIDLDDTVEL